MQLSNIWIDIGLYSIWQACTLDWTGFQSNLIITFVGTKLPQNMPQVQYLVHFCKIRIRNSPIEYDRIVSTQNIQIPTVIIFKIVA